MEERLVSCVSVECGRAARVAVREALSAIDDVRAFMVRGHHIFDIFEPIACWSTRAQSVGTVMIEQLSTQVMRRSASSYHFGQL